VGNDPLITIEVSKSRSLAFYEHFLVYKGAQINYEKIQGISYLLTHTTNSVNLIPTHNSTSFEIKIEADGKVHTVSSSATSAILFSGKSQKEKQETFGKLVYILDNLIKPFVLRNLVVKYEKDTLLKIGSYLSITPEGLSKKRMWRSPEVLPWNEYYNSALSKGSVSIYRVDEKKKYKVFFSCSMSTLNSVVLPELLGYLFQKYSTVKQPEEALLEEAKFCQSCGNPINAKQKFCINCGANLSNSGATN
jgi:ribosomal protein S27AE